MKFTILVSEPIHHIHTGEVEAATLQEAVEKAWNLWANGELESELDTDPDEPTFRIKEAEGRASYTAGDYTFTDAYYAAVQEEGGTGGEANAG